MIHVKHWILVLVQREVMSNKKVIAARSLKRLDQVYHSKEKKSKKKITFFNTTFLGFPEIGEVVRIRVWTLLVGTLCIHRSGFSG